MTQCGLAELDLERACPRSRAHRTPPPPGLPAVGRLPHRGVRLPSDTCRETGVSDVHCSRVISSASPHRELYLRHGFAPMESFTLPTDGPTPYPMWREPHATGTSWSNVAESGQCSCPLATDAAGGQRPGLQPPRRGALARSLPWIRHSSGLPAILGDRAPAPVPENDLLTGPSAAPETPSPRIACHHAMSARTGCEPVARTGSAPRTPRPLPGFGRATAASDPRQIQLGLRLSF